ncbi:hypothetical protein DNTS_004212 [Danionella cerebrum]|uniref:NADH dehydrogenase [ubiquinone] 1 beta subcomplex subunit 6 n=1 Tax=Danionella cerebrum TaxID=2873325 RepID=A0A553NJ42_9TELE|nr:hypothetical protein DNTS_004212 [Danionella translucida]
MTGYTPDEKLRFEQLVKLRRQWLKDQELSPREPVLPPVKLGPIQRFWCRFLEPETRWRFWTFNAYRYASLGMKFMIGVWAIYYYGKYHVAHRPYSIVTKKLPLYPGDVILETGEVVPEFPVTEGHSHH